MITSLPVPNPQLGLFLARQLIILRDGSDPNLIGANILADTGRPNVQGDIPSTAIYPRGWWVRDVDKTFLFINGSETLTHAAYYVDYLSGLDTLGVSGFRYANYLPQAADNYLLPFQNQDQGQSGSLIIAGHSLGGALAQHIYVGAHVRGIRTAWGVVTFGSPKIVRRSVRDVYTGQNSVRWMNDNDPVPQVPPAVVTDVRYLASLLPLIVERWSSFLQMAGGVSVRPDGTTSDVPVPPLGTVSMAASLANWMYNVYRGRETAHDLPEYVTRLANVVVRTNPPLAARVIESGPERVATLSRRDASREIQRGVDAIIHIAAAQNAAVLGVPPSRAFIPTKIGPIWWVTFGGQLVAVGPRRKSAGLMCVRGNEFLRRLQRMGGVDGNALGRLLVDYINAASTPDNGFTPVIARLD